MRLTAEDIRAMGLENITLEEIMRRAYSRHVAVPAFNIAYLPMVKPVVDAICALDSFGLVEVARPDIEKFGAVSFRAVSEEFSACADRGYVRLHQDHVPVVDEDGERVDWKSLLAEALESGYDSVMVDGSRLSLEENISVTKAAVDIAHGKGIPAEAELGAVLGHEKGPLPPYEELFSSGKGFTDPGEAERFVKETGVDWLSVAAGNIHGAISGAAKDRKKPEARLNIEHIEKIAGCTQVPLVLHGGSGVKQEAVLAGIRSGITKINVGTAIRQVYERALGDAQDETAARDAVRREMETILRDYYRIEGSASSLAAA